MKLAYFAQILTLALVAVTAYLAWDASKAASKASAEVERYTQNQRALAAQQATASASAVPGLALPVPMNAQPAAPKPAPAPVDAAPAGAPAGSPAAPATTAKSSDPLNIIPPPLPPPMPSPGSAKPATPPPSVAATPPAPAAPATGTAPSAPSPATPPSPPAPSAPTPAPTPAGTPATASLPAPVAPAPLTPLQRRVKDSPALGRVKEVVADQGFVTVDVGSSSNAGIKEGMKFDLRRDSAIVGRVSISLVDPAESIANLDQKSVPAGILIQPGDELISVVLER